MTERDKLAELLDRAIRQAFKCGLCAADRYAILDPLRQASSYLERVMEEAGDQPLDIGDSPSVREPPPVEASPSPRERSAVGAKRPLDLLSAASVLASGMDSDDEHGKCGHCTRTRCWCQ